MAKLKYIKEFNKAVQQIDFLSSNHDISLSNKLILIQQDLSEEDFNFDSFDVCSFFSNVFNILNQLSDSRSTLSNSCIDVLLKATTSRNKSLVRTMNFVNFLPAIIKLLLFSRENSDQNPIQLLSLVKNLLKSTTELDEHNMRMMIELLRDYVENSSNENICKLALTILANLTMKNKTAKYHVGRIIKTSKLQEKIDKTNDLVALKFLAVLAGGEFYPKDFPYIITMSFKSIQQAIENFDIEPIQHSIDLLECSQNIALKLEKNISENEENVHKLDELTSNLISAMNLSTSQSLKMEFFDEILNYFSQLLIFDKNLVSKFKEFTKSAFENLNIKKSSKTLLYLCTFLNNGGNIDENVTENIISTFNTNEIQLAEHKISYLQFLQSLHQNHLIKNSQINSIIEFIDSIIKNIKEMKIQEIDKETLHLTVQLIYSLSVLSENDQQFQERLNEILTFENLPIFITKAYMIKSSTILTILFKITSIEKFPRENVAHLMSTSNQPLLDETKKQEFDKIREVHSKCSTKYINRVMGEELNSLIAKINEKIDNNELDTLESVDMISIYRHKINYLNDHLNALNASLEKNTELCNELQHQNAVFRKVCEKQEMTNWCLEMDKSELKREYQELLKDQEGLKTSIITFKNKVMKENQAKMQALKVLNKKEVENESKFFTLLDD